ncbi:hypothetical protein HDU92_005288 [Lobulomyces angularis]|nr:hypothetical protein HDU92_005288 [Lobulomyces angularis]
MNNVNKENLPYIIIGSTVLLISTLFIGNHVINKPKRKRNTIHIDFDLSKPKLNSFQIPFELNPDIVRKVCQNIINSNLIESDVEDSEEEEEEGKYKKVEKNIDEIKDESLLKIENKILKNKNLKNFFKIEEKNKKFNNNENSIKFLPEFPEQVAHLLEDFRLSKMERRVLLLEGAPGIGKGTALQQWVELESKERIAKYLRLSTLFGLKHGQSSQENLDDEKEDKEKWRKALENSLGFDKKYFKKKKNDNENNENEDNFNNFEKFGGKSEFINSSFAYISQALTILRENLQRPPLLVIDDVQLLFKKHSVLEEKYNDISETFQWLLNCQIKDLLDVVLCSSEKSVLTALRNIRGFEYNLKFKAVESVDDEVIIKYLLTKVNPLLEKKTPQNLSTGNKFTIDTARLFVSTFDGNMQELENYCKSGKSIQEYINFREDEIFLQLSNSENSLLPEGVTESELKETILFV